MQVRLTEKGENLLEDRQRLVWGWQLRSAEGGLERKLALLVVLVSGTAVIADWISGYYGFGSLGAMLTGLWLMRSRHGQVK